MTEYFKVNPNLITLKCVLFFFFGAMGLLLAFLPLHMIAIGLHIKEIRMISIIAPCVALIGPFIVGPLADKLAGNNSGGGAKQTQTGRYLRIMIAVCFILGAISYLSLLLIPPVARFEARRPSVTFSCNQQGGEVLQERCTEERKCNHWKGDKIGSLLLSNCRYTCLTPPEAMFSSWNGTNKTDFGDDSDLCDDCDEGSSDGPGDESEVNLPEPERKRRQTSILDEIPPHLCYKELNGVKFCQVYTDFPDQLNPNITLFPAVNDLADQEEWCRYPVGTDFTCRINSDVEKYLKDREGNKTCFPVVVCDVDDPYDAPNSVLADSSCVQTIGNPDVTLALYVVIRSIADIFPTAAIALLDAAVIIATRETSTGRGDVGRQLAWGAFGFALFAPVVGVISDASTPPPFPAFSAAIIFFAILMVICTFIILFSNQMPLSPPEWWWHTRSGMLAMPMSAIKRYGSEIGALLGVLILLGIFWSALDSYLPWHLTELQGSQFLIGLTLTIGALPAVPFLWNAERVVDYCGHSNLLITAFTFYIIRYVGLSYILSPWWLLIFESFEVFTLALMWVTAVLYLRHLVPRRFTVTGQASAVAAHFCIGRCIGAIVGGSQETNVEGSQLIYRWLAISAAVVASIYFALYHFFFKPRYVAPTSGAPRQPTTVTQGMNGNGTNNGSYTPLRVYHNGLAKKGQFRY